MRKNAVQLDELPALAEQWCRHLGLNVSTRFEGSGDEELFPNRVVIEGRDSQWLLAQRGQPLDALQFLLHEAQGEHDEARLPYLDVQGFRLFRMKELSAMTQLAIEKARTMGSYTFSSLTPRERRWVHLLVARTPGFHSESEGTGAQKSLKVFRQ